MERETNLTDTALTPFTVQEAFALAQRLISAPENPTLHNVRTLRRARQWPTIGKGNQAFPRVAWPFVNVCLAHAAGAPAEAAANVATLRGLRARRFHFLNGRMEVLDGYLEEPVDLNGLTVHPTLGGSLDHFAEIGARVAVDILPDRVVPMARLAYSPSPTVYYALPFQGGGQAQAKKPITKSARLEPDMFRIISETLGAAAPASTGSIWQSAPNESAAPGRAAQSDQCRPTDATGVRDKSPLNPPERETQPGGASAGRPGASMKERHHEHVTPSTSLR